MGKDLSQLYRYLATAALTWILIGFATASAPYAQTVDIDHALLEDSRPQRPIVRSHPWQWLRDRLRRGNDFLKDKTGLRIGLSDTIIYQSAPYADTPHYTGVNSLDVYGTWRLVDSAWFGQGNLGFQYRDRKNWGPLTGNELAGDVGLPWGINNSGSGSYSRFNQLWWQQTMLNGRLKIQVGKIDEKTHFNQNRVASSDGRYFMMQSLVYSQTIAFPSEGLGFNLHYLLTPRINLDAGLADANGNPQNKPSNSINSFLEGDYFEAIQADFMPPMGAVWAPLGEGHYRLMGWHTAPAESHGAGGGVVLSVDQEVPRGLVPFLRVGYSPQGVYRTQTEVDWGVVSVTPLGRESDRLGIGASWAKLSSPSTSDQLALELFYRAEVVGGFQIAPDVQFVFNPALNPGVSFEPVFGIRVRAYI
jgi:porin